MSEIDVIAVTDKLIGQIAPVGESRVDAKTLLNLTQAVDLVTHLINEIYDVARFNMGRHEKSMKDSGVYAYCQLEELKDLICEHVRGLTNDQ